MARARRATRPRANLRGDNFSTYPTRSYVLNKITLSPPFRPSLAAPAVHVACASLSEGRQPVTRLDGAGGMRGRRSAQAVPGRIGVA
jgi:hypothetical protein